MIFWLNTRGDVRLIIWASCQQHLPVSRPRSWLEQRRRMHTKHSRVMVCVKCRLWLTMRALCRLPNILRWRVSDRVQGRWWSSPAHASGGLIWYVVCPYYLRARAAVALHDSYTSEQIMTSSATRFPMCSYLGDQLDNVQCARWSDITRRGEVRGL